jgi:hypothetical protein
VTEDQLSALRGRLVALRDDLLGRLTKELGAGEISLMAGVQAAIIAVDEHRDERPKLGDPGR